ncbi:hypothetical protein ZWY2020_003375 [Hordeum vulgare]|nr:hypothetical protein ZWY2020_003375 [Hordeum vulgare]
MSGGVHHSGVGTEKFHVSRSSPARKLMQSNEWEDGSGRWRRMPEKMWMTNVTPPSARSRRWPPTPSDLICEAFQEGLSEENVAGFVNAVVPHLQQEESAVTDARRAIASEKLDRYDPKSSLGTFEKYPGPRRTRPEQGMVKGDGYEKGKGAAGKEKENGKAKSVNYLIRQDSPLPPPVPRKGKHKARIRKAKEFPNAPMGEFICSIKKHPPPPPRLPDRTGAGVRAAASGSKLPHVSHVLHDEEKEEDAEDKDAEDEDKEYDEQNLFVVPPLQGGGDMSDDDTSE